jgi:hypothetical protein
MVLKSIPMRNVVGVKSPEMGVCIKIPILLLPLMSCTPKYKARLKPPDQQGFLFGLVFRMLAYDADDPSSI